MNVNKSLYLKKYMYDVCMLIYYISYIYIYHIILYIHMYILYFRVWDDSVHHSETSAESSFLPDVRCYLFFLQQKSVKRPLQLDDWIFKSSVQF